jgi:hypothetical protein
VTATAVSAAEQADASAMAGLLAEMNRFYGVDRPACLRASTAVGIAPWRAT